MSVLICKGAFNPWKESTGLNYSRAVIWLDVLWYLTLVTGGTLGEQEGGGRWQVRRRHQNQLLHGVERCELLEQKAPQEKWVRSKLISQLTLIYLYFIFRFLLLLFPDDCVKIKQRWSSKKTTFDFLFYHLPYKKQKHNLKNNANYQSNKMCWSTLIMTTDF